MPNELPNRPPRLARRRLPDLAVLHGRGEAMSEWKPIKSAPKAGTRIDIWGKRWFCVNDSFQCHRFTNVYWAGSLQHGDWRYDANSESLPKDWFITHWMPLPEPPK